MRCLAVLSALVSSSSALLVAARRPPAVGARDRGGRPACVEQAMATDLYDPSARDTRYGGNLAQYLVDAHDASATFNFCGGMMFQLVLSDKLRRHLAGVAEAGADDARQPVAFEAAADRMAKIPSYSRSDAADNARVFHGREVRQVDEAAGGMGFVIHLTHTDDDAEGWTAQERAGYDGWAHDASRTWRDGERLEREGVGGFRSKFGPKAFTLHHRFYLHLDRRNQLWLSAEDGCEGFPAQPSQGWKLPWQ